jgi:hypothetical protein
MTTDKYTDKWREDSAIVSTIVEEEFRNTSAMLRDWMTPAQLSHLTHNTRARIYKRIVQAGIDPVRHSWKRTA